MPRSIAVRVGVEQRLHYRLQVQAHDRLGDAVSRGGYPEDSYPRPFRFRTSVRGTWLWPARDGIAIQSYPEPCGQDVAANSGRPVPGREHGGSVRGALQDYVVFSIQLGVLPEIANRAHVAAYVRDLTSRPSRRGASVRILDSGAGLANATLQQRLTALRLFHDYLIGADVLADNPVGRGRYTPGKGFGGTRERGIVPSYRKLPWIPSEEPWQAVLEATRAEPVRNRMMLALAYDAALRREELCSIAVGDVDPARRMLRIRAETTKARTCDRVVPYSVATGELFAAYLHERRAMSRQRVLERHPASTLTVTPSAHRSAWRSMDSMRRPEDACQ
jgi:site-specific recombinase XerD